MTTTTDKKTSRRRKTPRRSKAAAKQEIVSAASSGEHVGDIVWTELWGVVESKVLRADMRSRLDQAGIDADEVMPDEVKPQAAFGRARSRTVVPDDFFFDTPESHSRDVVLMKRDGADVTLSDTCVAFLQLDGEKVKAKYAPGHQSTEVERMLRDFHKTYDFFRTHLAPGEVQRIVVQTIEGPLMGTRIKSRGGVYWVPAAHNAKLLAFQTVIETVGASELNTAPISHGGHQNVARGIQRSFEHDIAAVIKQLRSFEERGKEKGVKIRERSLEERLTELARLRERMKLVGNVLEGRKTIVEKAIKKAEKVATQLIADRPSWAVDEDEE